MAKKAAKRKKKQRATSAGGGGGLKGFGSSPAVSSAASSGKGGGGAAAAEIDRSKASLAFYDYIERNGAGDNLKRVALAQFPVGGEGETATTTSRSYGPSTNQEGRRNY